MTDTLNIDGLKVGPCMVRGYRERIAELEHALQNIANGDTPWLDGYSDYWQKIRSTQTPGERYQKYAAYVLGKEIEK